VTVCGIDVGSLRTPADVAWLERGRFVLDRYQPSAARPLPEPPAGMAPAGCFALDAPQSLPAPGDARRAADRAADTPTRVLPHHRAAVAELKAYGPFVEAGLTIFWACRELTASVVETYPRFAIRTLWPELAIPSKRKEPARYVAELWSRIRALGYRSRPPVTHDEIDAMLCALAAEAYAAGTHLQVGAPPTVDEAECVLREGYIVVPRRPDAVRSNELASIQAASHARADAALRGSWPDERTMDEAELDAFLRERTYCVVATATARGRAQARPVGFAVLGGAFWLATVAGGRLRNVQRDPWLSLVVSEGEGESHRAIVADGPVRIHGRPPEQVLTLWEQRFGSRAEWAVAWLELQPRRLFSYTRLT
jgi:predicted nuclease with RNAse H fold